MAWTVALWLQAERRSLPGDESGQVHFLRIVEADETKPAIGDTKIQLLQHKEQGTSATDS
jgi:hypothetical protein